MTRECVHNQPSSALFGVAASDVGTGKADLTRPPDLSERRRPVLLSKNPVAQILASNLLQHPHTS